MIRVNVVYPAREGARFDFEYYIGKHLPMLQKRMAPFGLTELKVDQGVGGLAPGSAAPYVCVASLQFNSVEQMQAGLAVHAGEIMGDIPNYTDIEPVIQVSAIRL